MVVHHSLTQARCVAIRFEAFTQVSKSCTAVFARGNCSETLWLLSINRNYEETFLRLKVWRTAQNSFGEVFDTFNQQLFSHSLIVSVTEYQSKQRRSDFLWKTAARFQCQCFNCGNLSDSISRGFYNSNLDIEVFPSFPLQETASNHFWRIWSARSDEKLVLHSSNHGRLVVIRFHRVCVRLKSAATPFDGWIVCEKVLTRIQR